MGLGVWLVLLCITLCFPPSAQSEVVWEMGGLSGNITAAVELVLSQGHDPQQPLFSTLPPAIFGECVSRREPQYRAWQLSIVCPLQAPTSVTSSRPTVRT